MKPIYKRIVLKLSGEALSGGKGHGLDDDTINNICSAIKEIKKTGVEIAIVVGGGNFWRGKTSTLMDRSTSDNMGMLGTVINALRLQASLEEMGVDTRVQTAIQMQEIAEPYIRRRAIRHLEKGRIVIFAAGTGLPYFSTDTTAALRACEIDSDVILIGKRGVDGVYNKDPNKYSDAIKFDKLTHYEVLTKGLEIMDSTAASLCRDNEIDLVVFGLDDPLNLIRIFEGEEIGTVIK
ncbi:UMP kinase [Citroniella saccharovorans]|uniref:Uridylate kinase n=1 Tax=Citroniella saccharovorans TaxID=2053367 RepID=A0AAW9MYT8_9FIRM|nr:UMP kinase [Citroniella saccharovorans]MEB3429644.1 UMP kinase [Citroniella saccharovorans]